MTWRGGKPSHHAQARARAHRAEETEDNITDLENIQHGKVYPDEEKTIKTMHHGKVHPDEENKIVIMHAVHSPVSLFSEEKCLFGETRSPVPLFDEEKCHLFGETSSPVPLFGEEKCHLLGEEKRPLFGAATAWPTEGAKSFARAE